MKRKAMLVVTILFAILPATLILVSNALYYYSSVGNVPEGIRVVYDGWDVTLVVLSTAAQLTGYVALFFVARSRVSFRVAVTLLLYVAAMAYEMISNRRDAFAVGLHALPASVALIHVLTYFTGRARGSTA